jgi:uncharacterized protein YbjQ (UPF0145 family)
MSAELPAHARQRLERLRDRALFTSDLTVAEFLLVREAGFDPVGLVMGSSIYHVGYQRGRWTKNEEMTVLTQAMYHARELAMGRMEEEAATVGADGVIGVRLVAKRHAWGEHMIEFVAIGTAVTAQKAGDHKAKDGKPFTSDLSGQDFWTLRASGYRPVGLVMGNCVFHVAHQGLGGWLKTVGQNVEMPNFTQALYDARELAMDRLQAEAIALGASGVVGTEIHEHSHGGWDAHVMEFFAVGTAVVAAPVGELPKPALVMNVNGT